MELVNGERQIALQTQVDPRLKGHEDELRKVIEEESAHEEELKKQCSPAGTMGLPPLLDARRCEWLIPDGAFDAAFGTLYDRILVYQIPMLVKTRGQDSTYGGGLIVKPAQGREREQREAPRGIIVGAGLKALDSLRSNGVDLGHIVTFIKTSVWSVPIAYVAGKWERLQVLRDGDLIYSEDTTLAVKARAAHLVRLDDGTHVYQDAEGKRWNPVMPWIADDM
jgi:hypothetical protein